MQLVPHVLEQLLACGPGGEVGGAVGAGLFDAGELGDAEAVAITAGDHFEIDGDAGRQRIDGEEVVAAHAAEAVEDVPDDGLPGCAAFPECSSEQGEGLDKPLAWAEQFGVFFVAAALDHAAGDGEITAVCEHLFASQYFDGLDAAFGVVEHECVGRAVFEALDDGGVVAAVALSVHGYAAALEVLDGAVGAAAIDGEDFVELVERQARHVEFAAFEFVPDKQAERDAQGLDGRGGVRCSRG